MSEAKTAAPPTLSPSRMPGLDLVRALRPRQWSKNVLVAAAPLSAGTIATRGIPTAVLVAFVAFCLASSAGYLINDVRDVESDRLHPTKRLRPIAAGQLSRTVALVTAGVLAIAAVVGSWWLNSGALAGVVVGYLALTLAYSAGLKRQPVIDLAVVASGFLIRAVAGGVASGVPLSDWFLLAASFGSLFMVAGKRYSDVVARAALADADTRWQGVPYTASYLRFVWTVAAGATIVVYALWSRDVGVARDGAGWAQASLAPFVLAILRYAVVVDAGQAGAPEDVVLADRGLQLLGVAWLLCFAMAAHVL